jgi:pteridine reductase
VESPAAQTSQLAGQWALITGAAKRIGACIARTLHANGANIVIHYGSSADAAEQLAAELNGQRPDSAFVLQADLREHTQLVKLVESAVSKTGGLNILVNNASTFYATPVDEITLKHWDDLIGTNLKAPLFLAQAAAPHLRAVGGQIINIVDIHSQRPLRNHSVYGAAKAGLAMLTRSLAKDLAPDIRVNGISPGAILWPDSGMSPQSEQSIIRQIPLTRTGEPDDIARTALFLVKDAPYITGQIIAVDGGRSVGW